MGYYSARIYVNDVSQLEFIDFSRIEDGMLLLKAPYEVLSKSGVAYLKWSGISIESFINGQDSVGMIISSFDKKFLRDLYISKPNIGSPIRGLVEYLSIKVSSESKSEFTINKGDQVALLRFVSKKYFDLLMAKDDDGVRTQNVEIKLFVNGEFKPFSEEQMISTGYKLVEKDYPKDCKFYEKEYTDDF